MSKSNLLDANDHEPPSNGLLSAGEAERSKGHTDFTSSHFVGARSFRSTFVSPEEREGGEHKPHVCRGKVDDPSSFPPGCTANFGFPEGASPFVQLKLPAGLIYEGKKSRCLSYIGESQVHKGTTRTKESAIACVRAWSWLWWEQLRETEKNTIRASIAKRSCEGGLVGEKRAKKHKTF